MEALQFILLVVLLLIMGTIAYLYSTPSKKEGANEEPYIDDIEDEPYDFAQDNIETEIESDI